MSRIMPSDPAEREHLAEVQPSKTEGYRFAVAIAAADALQRELGDICAPTPQPDTTVSRRTRTLGVATVENGE